MHKFIILLISALLFGCTAVAALADKVCFKVLGPNKIQFGEIVGAVCRLNGPVYIRPNTQPKPLNLRSTKQWIV